MAGPIQALVSIHGAGRNDTYGAALLDVAQDHLLWMLDRQGLFESGELVFRVGPAFVSVGWATPADFRPTWTSPALTKGPCWMYALRSMASWLAASCSASERRATMDGTGTCESSTPSWAPERLPFRALSVHNAYGFDLPTALTHPKPPRSRDRCLT